MILAVIIAVFLIFIILEGGRMRGKFLDFPLWASVQEHSFLLLFGGDWTPCNAWKDYPAKTHSQQA